MSGNWPTGWRQALLRQAGIEISQHALDVLNTWAKSTPIEPWTNNPIGLSAKDHGKPYYANTTYAVFATTHEFRSAFLDLLKRKGGPALRNAISSDGTKQEAWKAIRAMKVPGTLTESDYPAELLDRVPDGYRQKLSKTPPEQRKTQGQTGRLTRDQRGVRAVNAALFHAANHMNDTSKAIAHIIGKAK